MNRTESIYGNSTKKEDYVKGYLHYLTSVLSEIDHRQLATFIDVILDAREREKNVYFIGNGGSAATASHFANDLSIGTRSSKKPFRVQSLTDNTPVITAIANDFGYEYIFTKQLEALLQNGDVVVAISASGNSPNVINAVEYAKQRGCSTIGLTGFDGGKLLQLVDHPVHVPTVKSEYGIVEDVHMIFDHVVGTYLQYHCRAHD